MHIFGAGGTVLRRITIRPGDHQWRRAAGRRPAFAGSGRAPPGGDPHRRSTRRGGMAERAADHAVRPGRTAGERARRAANRGASPVRRRRSVRQRRDARVATRPDRHPTRAPRRARAIRLLRIIARPQQRSPHRLSFPGQRRRRPARCLSLQRRPRRRRMGCRVARSPSSATTPPTRCSPGASTSRAAGWPATS